MQISSLISPPRTTYPTIRAAPGKGPTTADDHPPASVTPTVGSYDFRNMTPHQMQAAMNDLIRSGTMSLDESSTLVSMIPTPLSKVNVDGQWPAAYDQPTDFIAGLNTAIDSARSRHDTTSELYAQKALDALQRLQGTEVTSSSLDITA